MSFSITRLLIASVFGKLGLHSTSQSNLRVTLMQPSHLLRHLQQVAQISLQPESAKYRRSGLPSSVDRLALASLSSLPSMAHHCLLYVYCPVFLSHPLIFHQLWNIEIEPMFTTFLYYRSLLIKAILTQTMNV